MKFGRRRLSLGLAACMVSALASPAWALPAGAPDPDDPGFARWVLDYVDDLHRGDQSHGIMEMEIQTEHWNRKMAMESWSLGEDRSLIRILAPKKERGTATLKVEDDLFTYLNKTGRTIKITGGMMGASWMGSHFTNDDLVRSTRMAEDYTFKKTFSGKRDGQEVHQFTLTPKPEAPVVWGKVTVRVRQDDLQPVRQSYYDESGNKVRELAFSQYRKVGLRTIPTRMVMKPLNKPGEYTRISWKKINYDVELDPGFFSLQRLKSM